ncbi:MAG TPA: HAD family hydrolase [Thermoplasmata archaeon]|nr:HAD family hydrolase [Thermoplasmata archaeon]
MNPYPVLCLHAKMVGTGPGVDQTRPIRRALFVDRDGTLNPDLHYLREAERLELFRGVGNALSLARDHGFLVVCVTNQSGVERGYYSREDVERIHRRLNELLRPYRAHVDAFYYCPHAPETRCECRKPGTLLFRQARNDWNIDFASSAIVGDRGLDVEAGRELGLLTAVVTTPGHDRDPSLELLTESDAVDVRAGSFSAAVLRILALG